MPRLRMPYSALRRKRLRILIFLAIGAMCVFFASILFLSTLAAMRPARLAVPATIYVCLSAAISWTFLSFTLSANYRMRRGWTWVTGCLFASCAGVLMLGSARERWHLAMSAAAAVAVAAALTGGAVFMAQARRKARQALGWSVRRPADLLAAGETYAASVYAMNSGRPSAEEQKVARLNMARAAIARSRSDDAADGLVMAADALRYLNDNPPADWLAMFAVATDLADAMSVRASKHGDLAGYPDALEILGVAATRMPADFGAMAIVHQRWASYHAAVADRAGAEGPT